MNKISRPFILLIAVFISYQGVVAQNIDPVSAGMSAERLERLTNYLNEQIDTGKAPGFVSIVYRNGFLAHYESFRNCMK